jgi:choline dehydrogenase
VERIACDVAVVGGGTSGCVVAGRLAAESDADVVLLEAGPDYGPAASGGWPADLLDGGALATSDQWGYETDVDPTRGTFELPRAKVIGGCSAHNGCIAAVGCPEDYDAWAEAAADPGWGADALRPLFTRALERLRVRVYAEDEVGPFHRACLAAAATLGWPRADDLHDLDGGVGFGIEPVNIEGRTRFNTAFAYLDPARGRANLRVVDRTLADRLAVHGDHAEIVGWRDGVEVCVRAATVVLAAGTYGSPAILLRSGIGDPVELARHGITTAHDLPGVGRNLHDHPVLELEYAGTDRLRSALADARALRFVPEEQTLGKLRSSRATGPYDLHVIPLTAPEHGIFAGRTFVAVGALEPRSRGRLTLRSADADEAPVLDHAYLADPDGHDLATLVEGVELVRALVGTDPLRGLLGDELVPGSDTDVAAAIRRSYGHYFHPVGTCAFGSAANADAVCDARGRVHGLERIVVADCALIPVVPRANTNVPAVVIGERIADLLLEP